MLLHWHNHVHSLFICNQTLFYYFIHWNAVQANSCLVHLYVLISVPRYRHTCGWTVQLCPILHACIIMYHSTITFICCHTNTALSIFVIVYQFILLRLHTIVHCSSNTSMYIAVIRTVHHVLWCALSYLCSVVCYLFHVHYYKHFFLHMAILMLCS